MAALGVVVHGALQEGAQGRGQVGEVEDGGAGREVDVGGGLGGEAAEEEGVEEGAEGVDIDAVVGSAAAVDLGGDVAGGAADGPGALAGGGEDLGEAEVEDLDEVGVVVAGDPEAVLRLDVAVDHAALVGGREGAGDLAGDREGAGPRERALAGEQAREVLALEVLHGEEGGALLGRAEVGDVDDVGVVDLGGGAGLLQEALADLRVVEEARADDLEGEVFVEVDVAGEEDDAHAAGAEAAHDLVAALHELADQVVVGEEAAKLGPVREGAVAGFVHAAGLALLGATLTRGVRSGRRGRAGRG